MSSFRDVYPAVALRVEQHLLDELPAPLLGKAALLESRAAATEMLDPLVAQLLQFAERQQPRARALGCRREQVEALPRPG
jgi:hypothetical protein